MGGFRMCIIILNIKSEAVSKLIFKSFLFLGIKYNKIILTGLKTDFNSL